MLVKTFFGPVDPFTMNWGKKVMSWKRDSTFRPMVFLFFLLITILTLAQFSEKLWRALCLIIIPRILGLLYYLVFVPTRKLFLKYSQKHSSFLVLVNFELSVKNNFAGIIEFLCKRLLVIQPSTAGVQCLHVIHNYFNKVPMPKLVWKNVLKQCAWNLILFQCLGFSTLYFLLIRLVIESLLQHDLPALTYFFNNFNKISPGYALTHENEPILSLYVDLSNALIFSSTRIGT